MTNEQFSVLADHTIRTLPDGVAKRLPLLEALTATMPADFPKQAQIRDLLATLYRHKVAESELQRELPFHIEAGNNGQPKQKKL